MNVRTAAPPRERSARSRKRARDNAAVLAISGIAGIAAMFAPVTLTGSPLIDGIERAVIAAVVSYASAHGHRRPWLIIGAIAAIPARGLSLLLVVAGLAAAVLSTQPKNRSKPLGAVSAGLLANAVFWYPPGSPAALAPIVGVIVISSLFLTGLGNLRTRRRRMLIAIVLVLGAVTLAGVAATGWAAVASRGDVESGTNAARAALSAVRGGDTKKAQVELSAAIDHLNRAESRLDGVATVPARFVPGLAQQVNAVQVAVDEGITVSKVANELVATDYDQLRYRGKLDLAQVSALSPRSKRVLAVLGQAERNLEELQDQRLVSPLRTRIDDFHAEVADARDDADLADELVDVMPGLLGSKGPRRYLIVFMQPSELRGAGGFVGNYAELLATDGDVDLTRSGRISELIQARQKGQRGILGPADYLERYGRSHPEDNLQDVTLSPDWPSVALVYAQLYPQSGGAQVDGVIGVDPKGLAALLTLTGPVQVDGLPTPLNADNAVSLLTLDQYLQFGEEAERSDILEAATRATFKKLTDASLPAPRRIGDALGKAARGRHFQVWTKAPAENELFDRLDIDGKLRIPKGQDGLSIVQQNVGNSKIDAYLHRSVDYRATVDADTGDVSAKVHVTLRNDAPVAELATLPRAVVGNNRGVPNGTNLAAVSIYTPQAITSASIDGEPVVLASTMEEGIPVWDLPLVQIPAGGKVDLVFTLKGGLDLRGGYHFRYLPQPMVNPDQLSASVSVDNGRFTAPGTDGQLRSKGPAEEQIDLGSGVRR